MFAISRRLDFRGRNIQVTDLWPNNSQKNNNLQGDGQNFYLNNMDDFGATGVLDDAYSSGSRNTAITTAANDAVADDTTGGGNNVLATQGAVFGLAAYLRERVHPGGVLSAVAGRMTPANALLLARELARQVDVGGSLLLASINVILSNAGVGGTAGTDLDGTAALSKSFGTVEEVLRILSGEVYRSPRFVIICNVANQFRSLAERAVLVAAQIVAANGGITFVSQGGFLTNTENGYVGLPQLALTGEFQLSSGSGQLFSYADSMTFENPSYAYAAADVTADRTRARTLANANIPATGVYAGIRVYHGSGLLIL